MNKSNSINKIRRRKFFSASGKALAGILLFNFIPIKIPVKWLGGENKNNSKRKINVTEHPLAVKFRTRKVNVNE